jgi:hypothetical protein
MRELERDVRAVDSARAVYDFARAEAKDERLRGGDLAVANATNLNQLKYSENLQQSGQGLGLDKGGSFGVSGGGAGGFAGGVPALKPASAADGDSLALATTPNGSVVLRGAKVAESQSAASQPQSGAGGYRAQASNYAQQARVVRGRAFYQNGNTWTDATAATKTDWKKRQIQFNSDEYFTLLQQHPEAAPWFALGNEVDVVLDDMLVSVR